MMLMSRNRNKKCENEDEQELRAWYERHGVDFDKLRRAVEDFDSGRDKQLDTVLAILNGRKVGDSCDK